MSYHDALEATGAIVHCMKKFGSYQGDWVAKITKLNGLTGWVHGSFGSCSFCDAFEREFYYDDDDDEKEDYHVRLRKFGERYLNDLYSYKEIMKIAEENADWDLDAEEMVKFIKENK
jgi:hypothetical protein